MYEAVEDLRSFKNFVSLDLHHVIARNEAIARKQIRPV
jgi:hypothetical protein